MADGELSKKLKIKPGPRIALVGAPDGYLQQLRPLPQRVEVAIKLQGKLDWIQVFVKDKAQLEKAIPRIVQSLKPDGMLLISYPKGTSKTQTDLTRDKGWEGIQEADLKWITLVSVDDTWSAFALRPYRPGEAKQSFR